MERSRAVVRYDHATPRLIDSPDKDLVEPAVPVTDDTPDELVAGEAVLAPDDKPEPVAVVLNDAAQVAELGSVTPSLRRHPLASS